MSVHKKILLMQFRTNESEEHEIHCFREAAHLHHEQLHTLNAVKENYDLSILNEYDALILGGSGQFYLSRGTAEYAWLPKTISFIKEALNRDLPILGVCFGHQLLGLANGCRVIHDELRMETGTLPVTKLDEANSDVLFDGIPRSFYAQLGHKDCLDGINGNIVCLARSDKVHPQAFRVKGKRAWGVLFHPEMNSKRIKERIGMFPEYLKHNQQAEDAFWDTPHAEKIIDNFMKVVEGTISPKERQ